MKKKNNIDRNFYKIKFSVFFLAIIFTVNVCYGGTESSKEITGIQLGSHSHFGWAVSLSNNTGLISAPDEDTELGKDGGAVYVIKNNGELQERIIPADGQAYDKFGYSVSHDGSFAFIGAIGDRVNGPFSGSVYIFHNNGSNWTQIQKIFPNNANASDMFGYSVSVKGNLAIVGARQAFGTVAKSGAAFVFRFDGLTWQQEAKLISSDGAEGDFFGNSVSLSDNGVIVIGAYGNNGNTSNSGAAYIFEKIGSEWKQTAKLAASNGQSGDLFGFSVSICKQDVLVGAYQNINGMKYHGAAYIFSKVGTGWIQTAKLSDENGKAHDFFGVSVAIQDSTVLIGASRVERDTLIDVGAVYVFKKSSGNWTNTNILRPENGKGYDQFGLAVALENASSLIGSRLNDNGSIDSGTSYFINIDNKTPPEIPAVFALYQNYPNPFNPATVIKYSIPNPGLVTLTIYNILGQHVKTLVNDVKESGNYSFSFEAGNYTSGIYFYRLISGNLSVTKKMILLH
jgi:hypothetical protein